MSEDVSVKGSARHVLGQKPPMSVGAGAGTAPLSGSSLMNERRPGGMSIVLSAVSFSYGTSSPLILADVSLEIADGEFVCVLGPSGCGKTTVLRLIAGFDVPNSGTISVRGVPVHGAGPDRGVVFQGDDSVFGWLSALQNVAFGPRVRGVPRSEADAIARKCIATVGLAGHESKFPGQLSGGMRQRIQIARVHANSPQIMLMDEPFGALDAQTRTELQDELARIWADDRKSVVFITHDILEAVTLADRVVIMTSGPKASVREIVDIKLPRPRRRSAAEVGKLYDIINGVIAEEVRSSRNKQADLT